MASVEHMSEIETTGPGAGTRIAGLAGLGLLAGLGVVAAPVVAEAPKPIAMAMTGIAGAGLLMVVLGAVLRKADPFYRGASVVGGVLMLVFTVSFLFNPLAGLILLTLSTFGVFVLLAVTYLFGPGAEAEQETAVQAEAAEPAEAEDAEDRSSAEVIRHPAWHTPLPANLPGAVALKAEVCKPHARLTL